MFGFGIPLGQNLIVDDTFAFMADPRVREPDKWMEPVSGLDESLNPTDQEIPIPPVDQLMEQHIPKFGFGKRLGHLGGKDNGGFKETAEERTFDSIQ